MSTTNRTAIVNGAARGIGAAVARRMANDGDAVAFEDFKKAAAAEILVTLTGTADDVANAVAFFVAESAGFVSGQVLCVAGGPTV